jgi:hypothetical protein
MSFFTTNSTSQISFNNQNVMSYAQLNSLVKNNLDPTYISQIAQSALGNTNPIMNSTNASKRLCTHANRNTPISSNPFNDIENVNAYAPVTEMQILNNQMDYLKEMKMLKEIHSLLPYHSYISENTAEQIKMSYSKYKEQKQNSSNLNENIPQNSSSNFLSDVNPNSNDIFEDGETLSIQFHVEDESTEQEEVPSQRPSSPTPDSFNFGFQSNSFSEI